MSKAAQTSDSAPETFEQYRSLKSSAAVTDAPSETEKAAPESDPVEDGQRELTAGHPQEPKPLTDEEKSEQQAERKKRNDERREKRWYEQRGEMRAEMRAMQEELANLKAAREQSSAKLENAEPSFKAFLESGRYKTYEEAQEAYIDARTEFKLAKRDEARATAEHDVQRRQFEKALQGDIKQFSRTHEDFADAFEVVSGRLDADALFLSDVIVRSENPAALIYELGTNEQLLDELIDVASLAPQRAIMRLGRIAAKFEKASEKAPVKDQPITGKPKSPKTVSGRGAITTREERMAAAAEANDFTAFQAAARAKDKA